MRLFINGLTIDKNTEPPPLPPGSCESGAGLSFPYEFAFNWSEDGCVESEGN